MTRSKHEAYFAQLWEQQAAKRERFAAGGSPQSTSGGNTNTPRGASACSPCVASHGESACGVQVDSEARCGAPDPVAVPTQRGRASSIHAPSEKVPAGSESPLSAGLRSTSGGVESRHAGSAASLNWGVGAAQVKTASADTTADLSGESGMPSVQLRPAGMRPEVRPHADNQGTAGVAPGPLTLNAAAKDARPSTSRGGVVPVPTFLAVAPIQRAKADASRPVKPVMTRGASSAPIYPLVGLCRTAGLPIPTPEHQFHPTRGWQFDYAWPLHLVALEIEGGIWKKGGGAHSHPLNIERDLEKYSEAAILGWRVVRVPPEALRTRGMDYLFRIFATQPKRETDQ